MGAVHCRWELDTGVGREPLEFLRGFRVFDLISNMSLIAAIFTKPTVDGALPNS
jgi:hypothetical protein